MSSHNLKNKLSHLTTVEDWDNYMVGSASQLDTLFNRLFDNGNIFQNIYVAIRNNPQNSSQEENPTYTYYNVGHSTKEITRYFVTKFGLNYFAYRPDNGDEFAELKMKLLGIYNANLYKYRKLVELMGYKYNPIWNVDGTELYSNAESIGDNDSIHNPTGTIKNGANDASKPTVKHNVAPYDNDNTKLESEDIQSGQTITDYSEYSETNATIHHPAGNLVYNDSTGEYEPKTFVINEKDNAFGVAFNGPERYYAEKRIRQGNIGVTKTQELIEAQRELVKFNILDEFFKDINEHILVGIY